MLNFHLMPDLLFHSHLPPPAPPLTPFTPTLLPHFSHACSPPCLSQFCTFVGVSEHPTILGFAVQRSLVPQSAWRSSIFQSVGPFPSLTVATTYLQPHPWASARPLEPLNSVSPSSIVIHPGQSSSCHPCGPAASLAHSIHRHCPSHSDYSPLFAPCIPR